MNKSSSKMKNDTRLITEKKTLILYYDRSNTIDLNTATTKQKMKAEKQNS